MLFDFCLGLCVVTVTGAVQPTDSIMLLFGRNSRQTTYNQSDCRLTSKRLETALINDCCVEHTQSGTAYTT